VEHSAIVKTASYVSLNLNKQARLKRKSSNKQAQQGCEPSQEGGL